VVDAMVTGIGINEDTGRWKNGYTGIGYKGYVPPP